MKKIYTIIALAICIGLSIKSHAQISILFAEHLQTILHQSAEENEFIGVSAAAIFPDGSVWQGVSGEASSGIPVDTSMVFMIASITKNMLATLVLRLDEEGVLSIEDSVGMYLPDYPHIDNSITITQLLNHTSGLSDLEETDAYGQAIFEDLSYQWSASELLINFQEAPVGGPGSPFYYSNSNYIVLAAIVESVTENPLEVEFRNKVAIPLNMSNTWSGGFEIPGASMGGVWLDIDEDGVLDDVSLFPLTSILSADIGAGNFISKPSDMVRYAQTLYEGEFLADSTMTKMLQPAPGSIEPPFVTGYGLGTSMLDFNGHPFLGHDGQVIHQSIMVYNPLEHFGIAICVNHNADVFTPFLNMAAFISEQLEVVGTNDLLSPDKEFTIEAYPNPFTSEIQFDIQSQDSKTYQLDIMDQFGRIIKSNIIQNGSPQSIKWDGKMKSGTIAPAGIYYYRITTGDNIISGIINKL